MKKLILIILFAAFGAGAATSFTEFYCVPSGDATNNLNSGTDTNLSARVVFGSGTFVRSTGVFTPDSGNPASSNIVVNTDFASIYTTSGASTSTFIALVTGTNATTVTVSLSAIGGSTNNVSETASASTLKIGGSWRGPSNTVTFPFGFTAFTMTNSAGNNPRVNFKNNQVYAITAVMTHSLAGPVRWQGFTTTAGDLGRATVDASGAGASPIGMLSLSGGSHELYDFIFSTNGTSGSGGVTAVSIGSRCAAVRVAVHDTRESGLATAGNAVLFSECEAYRCGQNGSANKAAISSSGAALYERCYAHDNWSNNVVGFASSGNNAMDGCISANNAIGARQSDTGGFLIRGSDFYKNTNGFDISTALATHILLENCNFIANVQNGINCSGGFPLRVGRIINCGFGTGTAANATNIVSGLQGIEVSGSVNYASNVTPWNAPDSGDFRITLTAAKSAGLGAYPAGISTTVAYPDIGAAQASDTNSASASTSGYAFGQ